MDSFLIERWRQLMKASPKTMVNHRNWAALRLLAVGGLAVSLAGCFYETQVAENAYPNDYRQRHPIVLRDGTQAVEVLLSRNRGGLTPNQRADVLSFAQAWRHEAGSGIIVELPRSGSNDRAVADSVREIRAIFAAIGVPPNAIYVRNYRPARSSLASIKLSYSKLIAEAGPCGEWPADLGPSAKSADFENRQYWNFGCANQRNLASMVDNPADLVQPRGETPPLATRRSIALDRYRKGENPSGTYTGYESKISDVGK
jgi:pilus assembly protein CpaD